MSDEATLHVTEALERFLRRALRKKVERLVGFVGSPRTRRKFLALLAHEFGELLDSGRVVPQLPQFAWDQPALVFREPHCFGTSARSLREVYDSDAESTLAITMDGRYGFWREETYSDSRLLVDVS